MTGPDGEFDDFLSRRKPVFRRPEEDPLEPPAELDRIVLRRAREAIETQPEPAYHGTRWGMPVALAATLLVVFSVFLHLGVQSNVEPAGEVTVQSVSQQLDYPAAAPEPPQAADAGGPKVAADLDQSRSGTRDRLGSPGYASEAEASRYSPPPPPPPVVAARAPGEAAPSAAMAPAAGDSASQSRSVVMSAPTPAEADRAVASASSPPIWRRDARTWLAEIDRLRAEGKATEAEAEMTEYKRQHRAYAGTPDR
jgi:hypothetical protein